MNLPPLLPHQQEVLNYLLNTTDNIIDIRAEAGSDVMRAIRDYISTIQSVNDSYSVLLILSTTMLNSFFSYFIDTNVSITAMKLDSNVDDNELNGYDLVVRYNLRNPVAHKSLADTRQINIQIV